MTRYDAFMVRVGGGEAILIDGGTGTECELRGVPLLENAWNGGAALSHPEIVQEIHADYLAAGARLIIANTFGTSRNTLEDAGVADDFERYNRVAVELACAARAEAGNDDVLVAGGISNWAFTGRHPSLDEIRRNSEDQARAMRAGGADVIILEMMSDIARMNAALDGALAGGLPVWVGLSIGTEYGEPISDDGLVRIRDGELLVDALASLAERPPDVLFVMHTDVGLVDGALDVLQPSWNGPIGVYAHSGRTDDDGSWVGIEPMTPAEYASAAARWLERGVTVIGGCCGTKPSHIEALQDMMEART